MTTNMAPKKLLDEAIALVNEKYQLKLDIITLRSALAIEKRRADSALEACTRSRSPRRTPKTDTLEHEARDLFRGVLMDHYIQGHVCGKDVDQWLRKHKGWFQTIKRTMATARLKHSLETRAWTSPVLTTTFCGMRGSF